MRRQGTAVVGCMLGLIMGMACAEVREETSGRDPVTLPVAVKTVVGEFGQATIA